MSASLNRVSLIGNLGRDPELRLAPNGTAFANVSLATSETWKDKETGDKKESTEWHRVVFSRRLAEVVGEYLVQGSTIFVEGKLKTRKWQDKDGKENYTTEIWASELLMLGGKRKDGAQASEGQRYSNASGLDDPDDLPFE